MKPEELWKTVQALGLVFIGEYRGSIVELVQWVDKTDGKAKPFLRAAHLFEFGGVGKVQSVRLDHPIPKTATQPEDVEIPFKRGARYAVQLNSMKNEKGNLSGRLSHGFVPFEIA